MAKFNAANIKYAPEIGKKRAANEGSAIHYALEHGVDLVYIKKTEKWDLALFLELYNEGYIYHFETADFDTDEYRDGRKLVMDWFKRTDLSGREVLSVEQKRRTPIPSARYDKTKPANQQRNAAIVPLTYIWDRCDRHVDPITGKVIITVVDYKSQRMNITADALKVKLQCKIYAFCALIYFGEKGEPPDEIRVQLDMLRYNPVEVTFTPQECIETYKYLRMELQRILDSDDKKLSRTLGPGCRYCPIAASCKELEKNVAEGGLMAYDLQEIITLRAAMQAQMEATKKLVEQADEFIVQEALDLDAINFEVGNYDVVLDIGKRRKVDQILSRTIMGDELYAQFAPMTMAKYDELMEGNYLTDEQKEKMPACIETQYNANPTVKVFARNGDQ